MPETPVEPVVTSPPATSTPSATSPSTSTQKKSATRAVLASLLVPGAPSFGRRLFLSWVLLTFGVLLPVAAVIVGIVRRNSITGLVLDETVLRVIQVILAVFVLTRLAAVVEVITSQADEVKKRLASFVAVLGMLVVAFPAGFSVVRADQLRSVINDVFVTSGTADPLAVSFGDVASDEYQNVLLLGGDEGPGRWALRTDTMILVSIHKPSGRVAMISIPRNLGRLKFPEGSAMADEFPKGFNDLANAIFPYVYAHPDIAATYLRGSLAPEAVALASAISYSMDVTIHDYVLVNMQGFIEIIDALGGVTVTLDKAIPMPGNVPGAKTKYPPIIGPGEVEMDGTMALGYVRSRAADSDYSRMGRQRRLLELLASQASGTDVLVKFPALADAMKENVRTSLTPSEFAFLADRLRSGANIQESVGLTPPIVQPGRPKYDDIADLIDALQDAIKSGVDFPFA